MWFLTVLPRRRTIVDADPMSEDIEDYLAEGDPDESYDDDEHQFDDDDEIEEPVIPDHRRVKTDDEANDWETSWSHNSDEPTEEFDDDDGFVFDDDEESKED
jgi:hypothetical protein